MTALFKQAIEVYLRHHVDDVPKPSGQALYNHANNSLSIILFGRSTRELGLYLKVAEGESISNKLTQSQQLKITQIKDLAARLIIKFDYDPDKAVRYAFERLVFNREII